MQLGGFTPDQARLLWQDYQLRMQMGRSNRQPIYEASTHRVFVKNETSEVIPPYACMQITGVTQVGERTVLTVEKPSNMDGEFLFNSQFEIPVEDTDNSVFGVGWGYRYGMVVMIGDEPTFAGAEFHPVADSWEIEQGGGPFFVYGRHVDATRGLIGRIGQPQYYWCKLNTDLAAAVAGDYLTASPPASTVSVYEEDGAGALVDTGRDLTVKNRFGIEYTADTFGLVTWRSGTNIFMGDCAPLS